MDHNRPTYVLAIGAMLLLAGCTAEVSTGDSEPSFGEVTFFEIGPNGEELEETSQLPVGAHGMEAHIPIEGVGPDQQVRAVWLMETQRVAEVQTTLRELAGGNDIDEEGIPIAEFDLTFVGGLFPADGRFVLQFGGENVTKGTFQVGQGEGVSEVFFAEGIRDGTFISPGTQFPSGTPRVVGYFRAVEVPTDAVFNAQWFLDDEPVFEENFTIEELHGEDSPPIVLMHPLISSEQGLPDGPYELQLSLEGEIERTGTFEIGGTATDD